MANEKQLADILKRDPKSGAVHQVYTWFATENGAGLTLPAIGNYASKEKPFYIQPGTSEIWRIERMIGLIEDSSLVPDSYGAGFGLTNGIGFYVSGDSRATQSMLGGIKIFSNGQWGRVCHDLTVHSFAAGNSILTFRWDFSEMGAPIRLVGATNDRLGLSFFDTFTGLVDHTFCFQGFKE